MVADAPPPPTDSTPTRRREAIQHLQGKSPTNRENPQVKTLPDNARTNKRTSRAAEFHHKHRIRRRARIKRQSVCTTTQRKKLVELQHVRTLARSSNSSSTIVIRIEKQQTDAKERKRNNKRGSRRDRAREEREKTQSSPHPWPIPPCEQNPGRHGLPGRCVLMCERGTVFPAPCLSCV